MFMNYATMYSPLQSSDTTNFPPPHEDCDVLHEVSEAVKAGHLRLFVTHENTPPISRVRTEKLSQVQKSDTTLTRLL